MQVKNDDTILIEAFWHEDELVFWELKREVKGVWLPQFFSEHIRSLIHNFIWLFWYTVEFHAELSSQYKIEMIRILRATNYSKDTFWRACINTII